VPLKVDIGVGLTGIKPTWVLPCGPQARLDDIFRSGPRDIFGKAGWHAGISADTPIRRFLPSTITVPIRLGRGRSNHFGPLGLRLEYEQFNVRIPMA